MARLRTIPITTTQTITCTAFLLRILSIRFAAEATVYTWDD